VSGPARGAPAPGDPPAAWERWRAPLAELADRVRRAVGAELARASGIENARPSRPVRQGAGDVSFALDLPAEECVEAWAAEHARRGPLSLLTEDAGWRHAGPGATGGSVRELGGFDHGGPAIVVDPIDGTRNLMTGLRSAWTAIAFVPRCERPPRLADVTAGIVSELPTAGAATWRRLEAAGGCALSEHDRAGSVLSARALVADADARADHGYFPFFRYTPAQRPALAELEARFFARLEAHEGADLRHVWDDQYISNAGQLVLTALGAYRMVVDARALLAARLGVPSVTSKPYDVAAAIACARAAGAVVTAADGSELDFPLDASTPVHFAAFANRATAARLAPHLAAALAESLGERAGRRPRA
jgi:fructose-1,6-bisphosphatase/inositol monophosphatase family enzyme